MHSPDRTLSEVKVRSPFRVSHECTALVARIIGIAARASPWPMSLSTTWFAPGPHRLLGLGPDPRQPGLQGVRRPGSKVQSISTTASPKCFTIAAKRAFDTNGLSSCRIRVWLLSSSSTLLRLPNRVFSAHHPMLAQASRSAGWSPG